MADVEKAIRGLHEIAIYISDSCGMIRAKEYVKKIDDAANMLRDYQVKELNDDRMDFEVAYNAGFQYGYQTAIKDMAKKMREMKTYGGSKQAQRAEGVPGVRKGSVEADKC